MREKQKTPEFIKFDYAPFMGHPKAALLMFSRLAQRAGWDLQTIDRVMADSRDNIGNLALYCRA